MHDVNGLVYSVEIQIDPDPETLKSFWLEIENEENLPFFLSWTWISCWLTTYNPDIIATIVKIADKPVAIGLFTKSSQRRHGVITSRQLRLNQVGEQNKDQIWIEYNDFLCLSGHHQPAIRACLDALNADNEWDEIILPTMRSSRAIDTVNLIAFSPTQQHTRRPCYAVDLNNIRQQNLNYLDQLTQNTRYQIRRSMRLYEQKYGAIKVIAANSINQALDFFRQAGPYHISRWSDSGYLNSHFIDFHENLIINSFESGQVQLLKITAGNKTIAILYYLVMNNTAYFYLHGLLYESNNKFKPGLVAHTLATEYFLNMEFDKYDYMGGYSQYKEQLADLSDHLVTVIIQRPRTRFKIESIARAMKKRVISLLR